MNTENDHDYFRCELLGEREKSIRVKLKSTGAVHWVPKSVSDLRVGDDGEVLEVESWFAEKEGMGE